MSGAAALETRGLYKNFGALQVARGIDFRLEREARCALIGPNGAGKTSFVNLLTGVLRPSAGSVLLHGEDITRLSQFERARRGIARTFQINQLFRGLTVLDNVCLAVGERTGACNNLWRAAGARGRLGAAAEPAGSFLWNEVRVDEAHLQYAARP